MKKFGVHRFLSLNDLELDFSPIFYFGVHVIVPDTHRYLAMDSDGKVYAYYRKPVKGDYYWYSRKGDPEKYVYVGTVSAWGDWKESLIELEE